MSKLIDELTEVVKTTPIISVDVSFIEKMNPARAYEGLELKAEYAIMIEAMNRMYDDAVRRGLPKSRAAAFMLGTLEEILRYVISKALRERLAAMGLDTIEKPDASVEQFKSYLLYAADQWGTASEKKAVQSLVKKVKKPEKVLNK